MNTKLLYPAGDRFFVWPETYKSLVSQNTKNHMLWCFVISEYFMQPLLENHLKTSGMLSVILNYIVYLLYSSISSFSLHVFLLQFIMKGSYIRRVCCYRNDVVILFWDDRDKIDNMKHYIWQTENICVFKLIYQLPQSDISNWLFTYFV